MPLLHLPPPAPESTLSRCPRNRQQLSPAPYGYRLAWSYTPRHVDPVHCRRCCRAFGRDVSYGRDPTPVSVDTEDKFGNIPVTVLLYRGASHGLAEAARAIVQKSKHAQTERTH